MPQNEIKEIIDSAQELCDEEEERKAEEILRNALKKYRCDLDLTAELARVLVRLDRDYEAERLLNEVLSSDPLHESAISYLGLLLDNSLRSDEAEDLFKTYLRSVPESHRITEDYCHLLVGEERFKEALELARKHAKEFANLEAAYKPLKYVLNMYEDYLETLLDDEPGNREYFLALSMTLLEQVELLEKSKHDLYEERLRLRGELEHLLEKAEFYKIKLDDDVKKKLRNL